MAYADNFDTPPRFGSGVTIDQKEIERILRQLISLQGNGSGGALAGIGNAELNFGNWRKGQIEFAKRLARISAEHARRAEKLRIRHKRVSLARRVALMVMVIAINLPIFL